MKVSAVTVVFVLGLLGRGLGQVVVIGPDGKSGPPPATREYCLSMETIAPNLKLAQDTAVRGKVSDQSNAPLTNSPVELRRFISESKQATVKRVLTDDSGNFDLGVVKQAHIACYCPRLAPSVLPNPPLVTVTAVSKADRSASASVTVHIVQASGAGPD